MHQGPLPEAASQPPSILHLYCLLAIVSRSTNQCHMASSLLRVPDAALQLTVALHWPSLAHDIDLHEMFESAHLNLR